MLTVYCIRHGKTEWNVENRMQGHLDSDLTAKGKNDADSLAFRLQDTHFDQIISSPSGRTVETAKRVRGSRSLEVKKDPRLREIYLGEWQGKTFEEIKEIDADLFDDYWNRPALYRSKTGENFQDVKNRVAEFLEDAEMRYTGQTILIVTHSVVIKTLLMICKNNPIEEIWAPPFIEGTSLTILQIKNGTKKLLLEGDLSHQTSKDRKAEASV